MLFAALVLLFIGPIALSEPVYPRQSLPGLAIFIAALLCLAGAVMVRVWASLYVGGRKGRELVRGGPYALVRNPLYVGTLIGAVGIGLCFGSITLGVALPFFSFLVLNWVVKLEETRLREEFGPPFDVYRSEVRRWMPKSLKFENAARIEVDTGTVMRTLLQALLFFSAVAVSSGLDLARDAGWISALIRLP